MQIYPLGLLISFWVGRPWLSGIPYRIRGESGLFSEDFVFHGPKKPIKIEFLPPSIGFNVSVSRSLDFGGVLSTDFQKRLTNPTLNFWNVKSMNDFLFWYSFNYVLLIFFEILKRSPMFQENVQAQVHARFGSDVGDLSDTQWTMWQRTASLRFPCACNYVLHGYLD